MEMRKALVAVLVGAVMLTVSTQALWAGPISVPNWSFESPKLAVDPPYAGSTIDVWQKAPVPAWWPYPAEDWRDAGGVFVNVDPMYGTPFDNADGDQLAFMFSPPGYELFQDISVTFEVGQSYHLTVGIEGGGGYGGYTMKLGVPMEIRLYYRDDGGNRVTVGATVATNTNATGDLSHLTDYQLDIPVVAIGDAWAGKNIGIQLISTVGFADAGGFWVIDNVRLVPEPTSLAILALSAFGLALRRRRN